MKCGALLLSFLAIASTPHMPIMVGTATASTPRALTEDEAALVRLTAEAVRDAKVAEALLRECHENLEGATAAASAAMSLESMRCAGLPNETRMTVPPWLLYTGIAILAGLAGGTGALLCFVTRCGR